MPEEVGLKRLLLAGLLVRVPVGRLTFSRALAGCLAFAAYLMRHGRICGLLAGVAGGACADVRGRGWRVGRYFTLAAGGDDEGGFGPLFFASGRGLLELEVWVYSVSSVVGEVAYSRWVLLDDAL